MAGRQRERIIFFISLFRIARVVVVIDCRAQAPVVQFDHRLACPVITCYLQLQLHRRAIALDVRNDDLVDDRSAICVVVACLTAAALLPDQRSVIALGIGVAEGGTAVVVVCRRGAEGYQRRGCDDLPADEHVDAYVQSRVLHEAHGEPVSPWRHGVWSHGAVGTQHDRREVELEAVGIGGLGTLVEPQNAVENRRPYSRPRCPGVDLCAAAVEPHVYHLEVLFLLRVGAVLVVVEVVLQAVDEQVRGQMELLNLVYYSVGELHRVGGIDLLHARAPLLAVDASQVGCRGSLDLLRRVALVEERRLEDPVAQGVLVALQSP